MLNKGNKQREREMCEAFDQLKINQFSEIAQMTRIVQGQQSDRRRIVRLHGGGVGMITEKETEEDICVFLMR